MSCEQPLSAGDSIVFALANTHPGKKSDYAQFGDSVCVVLTEITDLGATDPATGEALFRFTWKPTGQSDVPGTITRRPPSTGSLAGRASRATGSAFKS